MHECTEVVMIQLLRASKKREGILQTDNSTKRKLGRKRAKDGAKDERVCQMEVRCDGQFERQRMTEWRHSDLSNGGRIK